MPNGASHEADQPTNADVSLGKDHRWLRTVVENSSEIVTVVNLDGTLRYASPAFGRVLGHDPDEAVGTMNVLDLVHPEDLPHVLEETEEALSKGGIVTNKAEYRFRHRDGSWRWMESVGTYLLDDPHVGGVVVSSRDVTERKEAEEKLRFQARLLDAVGEAVIALDMEGKVVYWNRAAEEMYGWSSEEAMARRLMEMVVPEGFRERAEDIAAQLREGRDWMGEFVARRRDGTTFPVEGTSTPVFGEDGDLVGVIGIIREVTERKWVEERLRYQAHHDLLTDLPNRQLFLDRLEQALGRTRRRPGYKVAVLFVDLDNFKVVNDSLGHEVGDVLLVRVGERLRRCLRPEDTLARFGGDEFVMLVENVLSPDDAAKVAQRIIEELRNPFVLEGRELVLKASVGIALGQGRSKTPGELLKDADTAMYRAKEEGVGYRVFEAKMHEQALRRLKVEHDMRRAVEAEEFVVRYQPIMDLRTGGVWGSEALVRWEHPERGLLNPSQFVPVAEETGLIVPLGEKVLEEACRQAAKWQRERQEAAPSVVSVNLSARQLWRQDLTAIVREVMRSSGIEGRYLSLDITETLYITVLGENVTVLDDLKGLGVSISIDDFGMGYSSLSYLKRLPADMLKIDKSFVAGLGEDPRDTAIVRMMIDLAHSLEMRVVAEGVESEEQAEQLKLMGCDLAQGFYFTEPLSPEEVSEYLAR